LRKLLERHIEGRVLRWSRAHGILDFKMNMLHCKSWPDRCFWLRGGRPLLIELKRPGEKPTPLQQDQINELKELGYDVHVCDNEQDAIRILSAALEATATPPSRRAVVAKARKRRIVVGSRSGKN
jgi:hypothetical protein